MSGSLLELRGVIDEVNVPAFNDDEPEPASLITIQPKPDAGTLRNLPLCFPQVQAAQYQQTEVRWEAC